MLNEVANSDRTVSTEVFWETRDQCVLLIHSEKIGVGNELNLNLT